MLGIQGWKISQKCYPVLFEEIFYISSGFGFGSLLKDPDWEPGGQLITDPAGFVSHLDIFVPNEKKICCPPATGRYLIKSVKMIKYWTFLSFFLNFFKSLINSTGNDPQPDTEPDP